MLPLNHHEHSFGGLFNNHNRMIKIRRIKFEHDNLKLYDPLDVGWLRLAHPLRDQITEELHENPA